MALAIVAEGLKNVTAGASPMDIKRGIDKAVAAVVGDIKAQAEKVDQSYEKNRAQSDFFVAIAQGITSKTIAVTL